MKAHDEAESSALVNADIQAPVPKKRKERHCERTSDGERIRVSMSSEVEMGVDTGNSRESAKLSTTIGSVQEWTKRDVAKFVQELWDMDEDKTKAKHYAASMQAQDIDGEGASQFAVQKVCRRASSSVR